MIKGGACLVALAREGFIIDVVVLRGINVGLGVYRRRRGGRNSKYGANKAPQNITRQYAVPGVS